MALAAAGNHADTDAEPYPAATMMEMEGEGSEAEPVEEPARGRGRILKPLLGAALAVTLVGNLVHVPYYSLGPGPATDVLSLIQIRGARVHESDGEMLLMTASLSNAELTIFEYLWTFVDPSLEAVKAELIVPPGSSDVLQDAENLRAIEESKVNAERAAFLALGMPVRQLEGARVLTLFPGAAATDVLQPGDLVVSLDGSAVVGPAALVDAVRAHRIGDVVRVGYRRDGVLRTRTVELKGALSDPRISSLGVTVIDAFRFPARIEIDTARIGGPSGGLVFALAIVEALGPADLTRGRKVAVTGTIDLEEGRALVGPIGAITEKVRAAEQAGATIFIVPEPNAAEALAAAPDSMRIIGVGSLAQAVRALRDEA